MTFFPARRAGHVQQSCSFPYVPLCIIKNLYHSYYTTVKVLLCTQKILQNTRINQGSCKSKRTTNYSWSETKSCPCTTSRQVSRLKDRGLHQQQTIASAIFPGKDLPLFPVISRLLLPNYGDEFVQDLHLFPFSPKPTHIFLYPKMHCFDT